MFGADAVKESMPAACFGMYILEVMLLYFMHMHIYMFVSVKKAH